VKRLGSERFSFEVDGNGQPMRMTAFYLHEGRVIGRHNEHIMPVHGAPMDRLHLDFIGGFRLTKNKEES